MEKVMVATVKFPMAGSSDALTKVPPQYSQLALAQAVSVEPWIAARVDQASALSGYMVVRNARVRTKINFYFMAEECCPRARLTRCVCTAQWSLILKQGAAIFFGNAIPRGPVGRRASWPPEGCSGSPPPKFHAAVAHKYGRTP